jgi:hypothetical protein
MISIKPIDLLEYAQMQAAWLAFVTAGRSEHPHLDVVFAMLAGGAPLLVERLAARGGPAVDLRDPRLSTTARALGRWRSRGLRG